MYQCWSALGPFPGSFGLFHKGFVVNLCVFLFVFFYYAPGVLFFFFHQCNFKIQKKRKPHGKKQRAMLPYIVAFILCTYFGANLDRKKALSTCTSS